MKERRKYSRKEYKKPIYFATGENLFLCSAKDISDGGMRLCACAKLDPESNLTFFVDETDPVIAKGKVVWNGEVTMGVEFLLPPQDEEGAEQVSG